MRQQQQVQQQQKKGVFALTSGECSAGQGSPTALPLPPSRSCRGPPRMHCTNTKVPPGFSTRYTCGQQRARRGWAHVGLLTTYIAACLDALQRAGACAFLHTQQAEAPTPSPPAILQLRTHTDLAQQLLRVCPLLQLVDHHYRIKGAASLGTEHPLQTGGGQSMHRRHSDVGKS